ncbi:hypothetical protein WICPIJ_005141 [Wickerhamomyces pijperi]|uniref:Uncharacterized protein n=1 Tax=Wickerhamomyces pijperi TaxID=599730 RepID=A0A9P8Q691_WICPI|nr:hypothetical protein WICPIJ_005141 [Wickerhamomyces pijperi]
MIVFMDLQFQLPNQPQPKRHVTVGIRITACAISDSSSVRINTLTVGTKLEIFVVRPNAETGAERVAELETLTIDKGSSSSITASLMLATEVVAVETLDICFGPMLSSPSAKS